MTIIDLFPWLLAICAGALTGTVLARGGQSGAAVWVSAVAAGIASFAAYWLALKTLATRSERQRARREKWEREHREYQDLDSAKPPPAGTNLFYECSVCGNVIPSTPTKGARCRCRNIVVDGDSRRIEIRDRAKVKLFSLPAP
jgi:hypothetical protein